MGDVEFEWSDEKAALNAKKHNVTFQEAETAFDDSYAYIFEDKEHSDEEPRELLIGYSDLNHLLFISFIQRAPNSIRIISARLADRRSAKSMKKKAETKLPGHEHIPALDDYELKPHYELDYRKAKPNRRGRVKLTHGGARKNAGRKPAPEELVSKRVYLYPRHVKLLEKIDTNLSAAIRKLVDASKK